MSLRVSAHLFLLLALVGCGAPRPFELTVDGVPVDDADVSARATLASTADRATIELRVSDPGPPGVADAGMTYVFRVDLAPDVVAGDALDAEGHATMTTDVSRSVTPLDLAFAPEAGSDERFLGLFAWAECFCGSPGSFDEAVVAHVEIVEVTPSTITFSIDADVTGRIPGRLGDEHQQLRGTFTASRPAR